MPPRQALFEVRVDTAAFRVRPGGLETLLVKPRDGAPLAQPWSLPGARLLVGERLADAAKRAVLDHVSVQIAHLDEISATDDLRRDRHGGSSHPTISVMYLALLPLRAPTDT